MSRKFSFSGVIVVLICMAVIALYLVIFRKALRNSVDPRVEHGHVLSNSQN